MSSRVLPWFLAGGATAAVVYLATRSARRGDHHERTGIDHLADPRMRNASATYRPIGGTGEPYPDWVRALRGKSGVYMIRERLRDGSRPVVYVGESHRDRLYQTLTRHFQTWRRHKRFWVGQYTGSQSHDPGLTYDRASCTVAVRVLPADRAIAEEARLIARLRPRDNLLGQPDAPDTNEPAPF